MGLLKRQDGCSWRVEPHGDMRVPVVLYASEALVRECSYSLLAASH